MVARKKRGRGVRALEKRKKRNWPGRGSIFCSRNLFTLICSERCCQGSHSENRDCGHFVEWGIRVVVPGKPRFLSQRSEEESDPAGQPADGRDQRACSSTLSFVILSDWRTGMKRSMTLQLILVVNQLVAPPALCRMAFYARTISPNSISAPDQTLDHYYAKLTESC